MAEPSIFFVYAVHVPLLSTSGAVLKAVFRGVMVLIRWSAASKKKKNFGSKNILIFMLLIKPIVQVSPAPHKVLFYIYIIIFFFYWNRIAYKMDREWTLNKHRPFKSMLCSTGFAAVTVVKQRMCAHSIPVPTVPLAQNPLRDCGQKSCIFCIE